MKMQLIGLSLLIALLSGCSSHEYQLGQYVEQMKAEQMYNPSAALENLGYVPDGNGERMEKTYNVYTGKAEGSLGGTSSRVLDQ